MMPWLLIAYAIVSYYKNRSLVASVNEELACSNDKNGGHAAIAAKNVKA